MDYKVEQSVGHGPTKRRLERRGAELVPPRGRSTGLERADLVSKLGLSFCLQPLGAPFCYSNHGCLNVQNSSLTMHQILSLPFIDYPLNLNPSSLVTCPSVNLSPWEPFVNLAHNVLADDPQKVVKVIASNGKSGEQCELSYTNCKVVGNGSFGVVFQAKLVNGSLGDDGGDDDVAIKKVLQDKRFKVSFPRWLRQLSRAKEGGEARTRSDGYSS